MKKHFENLWNDAEELTGKSNLKDLPDIINNIKFLLTKLENENEIEYQQALTLGQILLSISHISSIKQINVYAALEEAIEDEKLKLLESLTPED